MACDIRKRGGKKERKKRTVGLSEEDDRIEWKATYVLQHGLHQRDGNFCLLHEVVFGVLHFEAGVFLFCRAGAFQAIQNGKLSEPIIPKTERKKEERGKT